MRKWKRNFNRHCERVKQSPYTVSGCRLQVAGCRFRILNSKRFLALFTSFILFFVCYSQQNLPLNREWSLNFEKNKNFISRSDKKDTLTSQQNLPKILKDNSCFKPYNSIPYQQEKDKSKSWFARKIKKVDRQIMVNRN